MQVLRPGTVIRDTPIGRGMRVVVIDPSAEVRDRLRLIVDDSQGFVLAGVSDTWSEGAVLLEEFAPELVFVRTHAISWAELQKLQTNLFPLAVEILEVPAIPRHDREIWALSLPVRENNVASILQRAAAEIFTRKAVELSDLIQRYMSAEGPPRRYIDHLKLERDGQTTQLPTKDVISISADGNYIHVHTASQTYDMRETMAGLNDKLDPGTFVRVHRSFIVNLNYVREITDLTGASSLLLLSDGIKVPIGPNYRDVITDICATKLRLTA